MAPFLNVTGLLVNGKCTRLSGDNPSCLKTIADKEELFELKGDLILGALRWRPLYCQPKTD